VHGCTGMAVPPVGAAVAVVDVLAQDGRAAGIGGCLPDVCLAGRDVIQGYG
jgi:hypothetical protein